MVITSVREVPPVLTGVLAAWRGAGTGMGGVVPPGFSGDERAGGTTGAVQGRAAGSAGEARAGSTGLGAGSGALADMFFKTPSSSRAA